MKGLLYKELRQNFWYILAMPFCGLVGFVTAPILQREIMEDPESAVTIITVVGGVIAYLIAGAFQILTLRGDDRKAWGYFITTTPKGHKGFMRMKYAVIAIMSALGFIGCITVFLTYTTVKNKSFGADDVFKLFGYLTALQLFFRAIDIPFIVRFGDKKGSMIKLIGLPVFVILFALTVIIFDIDFMKYFDRFKNYMLSGEDTALKLTVTLAAGAVLYFTSYLTSCALYLRGVDQYDK